MHLAPSQRHCIEDSSPFLDAGRKIGVVAKALMWQLLHEDPRCPSRVLLDKVAQAQLPIEVSVRQLNRLRVQWQLNRRKGRPRHAEGRPPVAAGAEIVQ